MTAAVATLTREDLMAEVNARLAMLASSSPWFDEARNAALRAENAGNPEWVRDKARTQLQQYLDEWFDSAFRDTSDHKALARELLLGEASAERAPSLPSLAPAEPARVTNFQLLNKVKASPQWTELGKPQYGEAQELVATWVLLRGAMMCDKKDDLVRYYQSKHNGAGSRASIKRWLRFAEETGVLTNEQRPRSGGKWSTTIYRINPELLNGDPS